MVSSIAVPGNTTGQSSFTDKARQLGLAIRRSNTLRKYTDSKAPQPSYVPFEINVGLSYQTNGVVFQHTPWIRRLSSTAGSPAPSDMNDVALAHQEPHTSTTPASQRRSTAPQRHSTAPQQALPISAINTSTPNPTAVRKRRRPDPVLSEELGSAAELRPAKRKSKGVINQTATDVIENTPFHFMHQEQPDNRAAGADPPSDVVVAWLAQGTHLRDWPRLTPVQKHEILETLRSQLAREGVPGQSIESVNKQIRLVIQGCAQAEKFEAEEINQPLSFANASRAAPFVQNGIPPRQAFIMATWPYYTKLRRVDKDEEPTLSQDHRVDESYVDARMLQSADAYQQSAPDSDPVVPSSQPFENDPNF